MEEYLKNIALKFARTDTANGREMIYRTDFENLLKTLFQADGRVTQINHDSTSDNGNKPDFVISKNAVPILYIEAKDIGVDLNKIEKSNQMDRYFGYGNLVLTDYVEFRFYRNGERYGEPVVIATFDKNSRTINPRPENFSFLQKTITDFANTHKEPIKRGKHLAQIMGGKAQRIRDNVLEMLSDSNEKYSDLLKIRDVVKDNLVSGLDDKTFADMYAQTLVYGLFAARYNDKSSDTFSRSEARELVPKTNPFLHSFFDHIAGANFPERLRFIVDELCEVFTHADVQKILQDHYGKEKDNKDPVIHFYEDFLREYDAKKKMEMGVFYTPRPVVQFIVRAVDDILKKEFGLEKGLADTEKVTIKKQEYYQAKNNTKAEQSKDGKLVEIEKEYHKVQVLDVATGTGTFLNEVIEHIHKSFEGQEGRWDSYVKEHLLPRLHGFELMMASYTIAHLKLGMTLVDSGVKDLNQRLGVYLTNTLEEAKGYENQGTLFGFMDAIAEESKSASKIKSEYPIMCVIGNPPYAISSSNKGDWIQEQVKEYKKDLDESNQNALSDDYVKFIRFSQHLIDKNKEGIIAYISNNSFIDGITHRKMRESLLKSFSCIYILDLHGNLRKKEINPDGTKDQNVFDIMQGVSINVFVKKKDEKDKELGSVYHFDLYGERKIKYEYLNNNTLSSISWKKIDCTEPNYFFSPKNLSNELSNENSFKINDLLENNGSGIKFRKDNLLVKNHYTKNDVKILLNDFKILDDKELCSKYSFQETKDWKISEKRNLFKVDDLENIRAVSYRPFETRFTYYPLDFISKIIPRGDSREKLMKSFLERNIGLISKRGTSGNWNEVFISNTMMDLNFLSAQTYVFPLFHYNEQNEKIPNLDKEIWKKINETTGDTTPENILDYIYAVLHSPFYRKKYQEFLKIDFPRVPYPKNKAEFFKLAEIGERLRSLHLMTSSESNQINTTYPVSGEDVIEKVSYKDGNVYINSTQYFGNVPEISWNFYIGGYQPAQKYLKDRKGRKLTSDEIEHYQKIITVLEKTDELMKQVDKVTNV